MKDLQKTYDECIQQLDAIGIDFGAITRVYVNTRAKKRWGRCRSKFVGRASNGKPVYTHEIDVSSILLDEAVPEEALKNTLIHEILHTCPGCQNHGMEWKARAEKVRRELGYEITRVNSAESKGISEEIVNKYNEPKYIIRCTKCGHEVRRFKASHLVKYPELWRCGCGGSFKRIK